MYGLSLGQEDRCFGHTWGKYSIKHLGTPALPPRSARVNEEVSVPFHTEIFNRSCVSSQDFCESSKDHLKAELIVTIGFLDEQINQSVNQ